MESMGRVWKEIRAASCGLALITAGVLAAGPWVLAQDAGAGQRAERLSNVEGQVQLSQGDTVLAQQALANTPLFEGSRLVTADDGRAEVQFEDGSIARIAPNSALTLSVLRQEGNSTDTELTLQSGLGYFEIQGETQTSHFKIRFGNSVVTASGFTVMRIDLDNPPGELAVFSGNAHLEGADALAIDLHGGESVKLNGADPSNYVVAETIDPDSWDAWNSDRDQALTTEEADRTSATSDVPNSNNPAWSDLDSNGNWYNVPGQGYVWSPYEAENAGWDPYGCGSWVWTPSFGYIWVSCESWGYMPYESGSWSYYDGIGWGWEPGGSPWWGGGGWFLNVRGAPLRFRPPHRPHGGPLRPGGGTPIHSGGRYEPYPVVAVNRLQERSLGAPVRVRNGPVVYAGNTVQPLRPIAPRATYDHVSGGEAFGPGSTYSRTGAGVRYGYTQAPNQRGYANPGYWNAAPRSSEGLVRPSPGYGGTAPRGYAPAGRAPAPSSGHSSGGGGAPRGGGGGGGAPRGGGGGGGGASHGGGGSPHR